MEELEQHQEEFQEEYQEEIYLVEEYHKEVHHLKGAQLLEELQLQEELLFHQVQ